MGAARGGEQLPRQLGNYMLHHELASGGMATVYLAQLMGPLGFNRVVAIKRMRPQYASDVRFVRMFVDEAWLAARVHHPNVVSTLDVLADAGELFIVMEYVRGESLSFLMRESNGPLPPPIAAALVGQALGGLHAAHEATDEAGRPLGMIHRDVSPQNIVVGIDGFARLTDFGIAKAASRLEVTQENQLKGKIRYMSPEQIVSDDALDRKADVYAMGVILWEALAGQPMFGGSTGDEMLLSIVQSSPTSLAELNADIPPAVDEVVKRAICYEPRARFASAAEFQVALEQALPFASARAVGEWTQRVGGRRLQRNKAIVELIEQGVKSRRGLADEIRLLAETADAIKRGEREQEAPTVGHQADGRRFIPISASNPAGEATLATTPTGFEATRDAPPNAADPDRDVLSDGLSTFRRRVQATICGDIDGESAAHALRHYTQRIRHEPPPAVLTILERNKPKTLASAVDQIAEKRPRTTDRMPIEDAFHDRPTDEGPTIRNLREPQPEPATIRNQPPAALVAPTVPYNPEAARLVSQGPAPVRIASPPVASPPRASKARSRWLLPLAAVVVLAVSAGLILLLGLGSHR